MGALLKRRLGSLLAGRGKGGPGLLNPGGGVLGAGSVGSPAAPAPAASTVHVVFTLPTPAYVVLS